MTISKDMSVSLQHLRRVVALLGMAVATGILTSLAMMMFVLLFSGAASAQTTFADRDVSRGELLFKTETGERVAAPLVATEIDAQLNGLIGRVRVTQTFKNPTEVVQEAVYAFPLPENAAVDRMSVVVGERRIEGQVKERQVARQIYEQAKSEGKRTALIEQWRPNIFTTSVAPIQGYETVVVTIEYQQSLRYDQGKFSWRFPLAITPRYLPGAKGVAVPVNEETPIPTTPAQEVTALSEPSLSGAPLAMDGRQHAVTTGNRVAFDITLAPGAMIESMVSAYHPISMTPLGNQRYRITLKDGVVPADRDFELTWTPKTGKEPMLALYQETFNDESYYYLMVLPGLGEKNDAGEASERAAREITFIIDTSGSMGGNSIRQAKQALQMAVARLSEQDYFNVIEFNSVTHALYEEPVPVTRARLEEARRWINELQARGGTEMYPALEAALTAPRAEKRIGQVVFLTDGAVGNEEQLFNLIEGKLKDRRLFTIGIGSAPNAYFMSKAAQFGRGTFTFIGDMNEVNSKMMALFSKLETPCLTDITALWPGDVEMLPNIIGDLYQGEPVVVVARAAQSVKGEITFRGKRANQDWQRSVNNVNAVPAAGIATLWARSKIDQLQNEGRQLGNEDETRQAVVAVALKHHLVSRFTSMVAVDVTPVIPAGTPIEKAAVPQTLPNGMDQRMAGMAGTATSATLNVLFGLLMLLSALVWEGFRAYQRKRVAK